MTGNTNVKDFPTTANAFQPQLNTDREPAQDCFVAKLNPLGSALLYSTYLGAGGNLDYGTDIKVDNAGNIYLTGITGNGYVGGQQPFKSKFPVTAGAYQTPDAFGLSSSYIYAFVTKLSPTGNSLVYSTLLGTFPGSRDFPRLALDREGNVFITGQTASPYYPTTPGAFKTTFTAPYGYSHIVVTKLNPIGSELIYSTFLGGNYGEESLGIGIDAEGNATIAGLTNSSDYPQTGLPETYTQATGVLTKLNVTGSVLLDSRFIPFSRPERLTSDASGNVYLIGFGKPSLQFTPNAY